MVLINHLTNAIFSSLIKFLRSRMMNKFHRKVSLGDLICDRWENAHFLGFGDGSSCYDNVLVIGDVKVGKNTWIGPQVILDGSGGCLQIGDNCSISAGVQIYTHHTVARTISIGNAPIENAPTTIGNGVYIGPQSVIQMGVTIGDHTVVGAMSFVNKSIPSGAKAYGIPAKITSNDNY